MAEPARQTPPLRQGADLRCPHCRQSAPEQAFTRIPSGMPEFAPQTVPVYRCYACRKHFALKHSAE